MTSDGRRSQSPQIPSQRGRKRQKLAGTMQRFAPVLRFGTPRNDLRPPANRQPEGAYLESGFTHPTPGPAASEDQMAVVGSVANHCKILQRDNGFVTRPGRRAYFTPSIEVGGKTNR
jgi:hypothetical protein